MAKKVNYTRTELDLRGNTTVYTEQFDVTKKTDYRFSILLSNNLYMLHNISCILDFKVFLSLSSMSEYNKGYIELTSSKRKEIIDSLETNHPNFGNSIGRLKKLRLIAGSRDRFYINPLVHWRGEMKEREHLMKYQGRQILELFDYTISEIKEINKQYKFLKPTDLLETTIIEAQVIETVKPPVKEQSSDYLSDENYY